MLTFALCIVMMYTHIYVLYVMASTYIMQYIKYICTYIHNNMP